MATPDLELRILDLSKLDALDIRSAAGDAAVKLEEPAADPLSQREPVSTAILLLSLAPPVIKIIAEWLARRKSPKKIRVARTYRGKTEVFEFELPSGTSLNESQAKVLVELAKIAEVAGKSLGSP